MKNINEEINRMKSLFTEERLFGNLVEQDKKEETDICKKGDCQNGQGTKIYNGKLKGTYVGEFKDGERNGKGIWTWLNNRYYDHYEGDFKNDTFEGKGTLYNKDKQIYYVGYFKDNEFYGDGEKLTKTGGRVKTKDGIPVEIVDNGVKNEAGCKRILDRYVRHFEKNPDYLDDVMKKKDEENSVFKYVNFCNKNFGYQYSGNKNILRFFRNLGIDPNTDLPGKTDKKTSLPIVDENGNKWGTLKREKTFEYSITGEEGVGIIVKGGINTDELFTDSLYDDLISFNSEYKDYDIDDILNKMTIISKDDKSKRQSIRFRIDI